ncbi:hypothetical protein [Pyrodictium abyssi]
MPSYRRLAGLSSTTAVAIITLIAVVSGVMIYMWVSKGVEQQAGEASETGRIISGAVKIDAIQAGPGYVLVYARSLGGTYTVDHVYLYDSAGRLLGELEPQPPILLRPGEPTVIAIPLLLVEEARGYQGRVRVVLSTRAGKLSAWGTVDLTAAATYSTVVGLLAGRDVSCRLGDRRVDVNQIHWLYVDVATGRYSFRYIGGGSVQSLEGTARVIADSNVLDLSKMTPEERYSLGPVVVIVNPYRAARDYEVTVIDTYGGRHTFPLPRLVDDPAKVVIDVVVLWEDLWTPANRPSPQRGKNYLDNYIDHVIRVTVFTNSTARIEVLHASGCFLHMFMYSPRGLPSFDSVPDIVEEYMASSYRLPRDRGVVYVKSHRAAVPPLEDRDIWDPVEGRWVMSWPPVFTVG